jgi:hypothetical protein
MKHFAIIISLLFVLILPLSAQEDEEILIELQGSVVNAAPRPTPMLWDYNARQLTNKWRGKTREQLLYTVPIVSDRDGIVRGQTAEYMLVEYFLDGQFRKFLFRAESPQTFIAAAATPADVLAINKKYKVNIGLWLTDFQTAYANHARRQAEDILPENTFLYQLSYTDVNTPKSQLNWFLFENKKLAKTFYTRAQKEAYLQQIREQHIAEEAEAKAVQTAAAQEQASPVRQAAKAKNKKPFKALLSGGTVHDQMYLPRIISPSSTTVLKTLQGS